MWPTNALMVSPEHFQITYAINPHMQEASGELKSVKVDRAHKQWRGLQKTLESQGLRVHVLPGQAHLPDMVFSANQMFPFQKSGRTQFILSRMRSSYRQPEVSFFASWCRPHNFEFYPLPEGLSFEGMGDALWNYETREIYGGYGFRTDPQVYPWLSRIVECPITPLELVNENFYHLDTALSILNKNTALVVPQAFSPATQDLLRCRFQNLIEVDLDEAQGALAANACGLGGKTVLMEAAALRTQKKVADLGFEVIPLNTSEFLKAGGSLFCLKLLF